MTVLGVLEDLMFTVKIVDVAKRAGWQAVCVKTREDALRKAREGAGLVVVDLAFSAAHPLTLVRELKEGEETKGVRVMGYLPHVMTELKKEAERAGCDVVVARSVFGERLGEELGRVG